MGRKDISEEALEMIEFEIAGLILTTKQAEALKRNQGKKFELAIESRVGYIQFPDDLTLKELWSSLRDRRHAWQRRNRRFDSSRADAAYSLSRGRSGSTTPTASISKGGSHSGDKISRSKTDARSRRRACVN